MTTSGIELYSKAWCDRIREWRNTLCQRVAHLPLLDEDADDLHLPALELVELTICGEMDTSKQDCANPAERKPIVFHEWTEQAKEDGGGMQCRHSEHGRFVRMTVYAIGRSLGSALKHNDTSLVVYTTAVHEDGTAHPPRFESIKSVNAMQIAQYKVLERYAR